MHPVHGKMDIDSDLKYSRSKTADETLRRLRLSVESLVPCIHWSAARSTIPAGTIFTTSATPMRLARRLCNITAGFTNKRRSLRPMLSYERPGGLTLFSMCGMTPLSCQSLKTLPCRNGDATNVKLCSPRRSMSSRQLRARLLHKAMRPLGCATNATLLPYSRPQPSNQLWQNPWLVVS